MKKMPEVHICNESNRTGLNKAYSTGIASVFLTSISMCNLDINKYPLP